jgi:hypothetical protein
VTHHPDLLPLELQVPALAILLAFLAWVIRLIRTQRLTLRDSLVWLLTTLLALTVTAFPTLLVRLAALVGVQVPANAIFGAGLLYLAVNVLSVTLVASANAARARRLVQECALLRAEVAELRAAIGAEPRIGGSAGLEPEADAAPAPRREARAGQG